MSLMENPIISMGNPIDRIGISIDAIENPIGLMENPIISMGNPIDRIGISIDAIKNPIDLWKIPSFDGKSYHRIGISIKVKTKKGDTKETLLYSTTIF